MKRGFFYTKGTDERIPYWVSEEQADKFAVQKGGTKECFRMALPGYGIMNPVVWEFREADTTGRTQ
jgi:hypothetical protein